MDAQSLPDVLNALRRQELPPPARQAVEEAGTLLAEGREMEACALAEKAQALATLAALRTDGKPNGSPITEGAEQLAARLGADITAVLTRAIHELQHFSAEQAQTLTLALEKRILALENSVQPLAGLPERCDQLAQSFATQFEALMDRLSSHEERFAAADHATQDLAATLADANQRLDRHAEILRGIEQRRAQRSVVISELLGTLAKLREHTGEAEAAAQSA
jgi:chromosome segregation ATPase